MDERDKETLCQPVDESGKPIEMDPKSPKTPAMLIGGLSNVAIAVAIAETPKEKETDSMQDDAVNW